MICYCCEQLWNVFYPLKKNAVERIYLDVMYMFAVAATVKKKQTTLKWCLDFANAET